MRAEPLDDEELLEERRFVFAFGSGAATASSLSAFSPTASLPPRRRDFLAFFAFTFFSFFLFNKICISLTNKSCCICIIPNRCILIKC